MTPPKLWDDFIEANVKPTAGTASGSRVWQGIEKTAAGMPGGANRMECHVDKMISDLGRYGQDVAESFGPVATKQGLGAHFRSAAQGAVKRFTNRSERLYADLYRYIAPDDRAPVENLQRALRESVEEYADASAVGTAGEVTPLAERFAGASLRLLKDVMGSTDANGTVPFRVLQRLRSDIGKQLGDPTKAVDDLSRAELKHIYAALSDDILAVASTRGNKAVAAFNTASRYYRFNMTQNIKVLDKVLNKQWDEQAFTFAMSGLKDGAHKLRQLKRNMLPQEWNTVAGTVLANLGKAKPGMQDVEGSLFSPSTFLANWNRVAPEAKTVLFGGKRYFDLRPALDRLARLAASVKDVESMANPSGTGRRFAFLAMFFGGGTALTGDVATAAQATASVVILPNIAARLLTFQPFVRWLTKTPVEMVKPNSAAAHIGRLDP